MRAHSSQPFPIHYLQILKDFIKPTCLFQLIPNLSRFLKYVFIDDPVSSLDENHLIELAVDIAKLIKLSKSELKFVITTHSPLFYNVLWNELNNKVTETQPDGTNKRTYNPDKEFKKYRFDKKADGLFQIEEQSSDSPFSYHLFLLSEIQLRAF